ncbi:glycosyltransferase family 2 protein [Rhodoferax sp. AJA081-3]|uniref:glycosyltransferase family 2 protein n=1 Tax=Rhodoferax sp. AJA081-3 TaxID=2752316 RepID=UPI001AE06A1B|nr:glycosyltransferase family 2 protein [Rhodoferax sp. AJA081-3]QTN26849.1 glycosyltransferase family 2 protein [Rhodoferax sp. AJA081-3]
MTPVTVLLGVLAALLLIPCGVLCVQTLSALLLRRQLAAVHKPPAAVSDLPDVCLLMPAHNEASGIATVLRVLLPQLGPHTRLLVVADNCTDSTAAIVREFAQTCEFIAVVERHNAQLRGKGYALDYGVQHLTNQPPEVLVVVDADCEVAPGAIDAVSRLCSESGRPVQALYLMKSPRDAGVKVKLAQFAWLVKNHVRPLGFQRMGLPCQLMGTGMAFTWQQISQAKLHTGHIVEDMQLGIDLALAGSPPLFCPDALVTSMFPATAEGLDNQRTRWEHGHLGVILSQMPQLLWQGVRRRNWALFAMALDLCVPPVALLALLMVATMAASLALTWGGGNWLPLTLSAAGCMMLGGAVMGAWYGFGQGVISFWQLCKVPTYVLTKLPLYFYFLVKRQSSWVRSKRDGEQ